MKIKFLDDVKQVTTTQQRAVAAPLYEVREDYERAPGIYPNQVAIKWLATVGLQQWIPVDAAGDEIALHRRTARRAICHALYGEIETEIRQALREMWEEGQHRSQAAERLEAMLPALRGEE